MIITDPIILQPYGFVLYGMSTENSEEDKRANELFIKYSKSIGIKDSFQNDDGREYESAFTFDLKDHQYVGCIYIRNKRIKELSLDHELIHLLNCINEKYAISTKYGEDEAVACFFEYMKENFVKLIMSNGIKVIRKRYQIHKKSSTQKQTQETSI